MSVHAEIEANTSWRDRICPAVAKNISTCEDTVEVVLVAAESEIDLGTGRSTKVWAYNGVVPGPTIEARVGQTLIVHLYNRLPAATTIHWHGVELPANMDGSNIAQPHVPPGGYFRYEFKLVSAAFYWYHPHVETHIQNERGLHGTLIVRPKENEPEPDCIQSATEHILVLDDILLDDNGQVREPAFPSDPLENTETHFNGREGNHLLVNGRTRAVGHIQRGVLQRLRVVNVANSRFMRLSFPGQDVWRIGGDGGLIGEAQEIEKIELLEVVEKKCQEEMTTGGEMDKCMMQMPKLFSSLDRKKGLLLTPGERADLVFVPKGCVPVRIEWHDFDRGLHVAVFKADGSGEIEFGDHPMDGKRPWQTLVTLHLSGDGNLGKLPELNLREVTPIENTEGAKPIPVDYRHSEPNRMGKVVFGVQQKKITKPDGCPGMAPLPFEEIESKDVAKIEVGETRIWKVTNHTGADHNFHAHGWFFQHIKTEFLGKDDKAICDAEEQKLVENKDTILVPKRPGKMGTKSVMHLVMKFTSREPEGSLLASGKTPKPGQSGGWVFHCHINEHSEVGMMSFIEVCAPPKNQPK